MTLRGASSKDEREKLKFPISKPWGSGCEPLVHNVWNTQHHLFFSQFLSTLNQINKNRPKQDKNHRAVKMHLEFDLLKGAPLRAQVTNANESEIAKLESALAPGKLYCLDAAYAKYSFLDKFL